jgi:uncharacterized coiled-coil protein SlyX
MNHLTKTPVLILALMIMLFLTPSSHAQSLSREQISDSGYIDWLSQKVYATGVGIAPKDKENLTQAKTMAYRAAVVVAQRNLLEVIKGVHINSQTILEQRILVDDKIISKIEGIVQFSQVESSRVLENNAVSVTLSMPIAGRMGEVIVRAIEGKETLPRFHTPSKDLTDRLQGLEKRVTALENKLTRLNEISTEQKSVIHLLTYLVESRQKADQNKTAIQLIGFASDEETAALRHQMNQQEMQMASMSIHLNDLARRLAELEKAPVAQEPSPTSGAPAKSYPYTGLIVDARDIGFKPSLRPEFYHRDQLIYPGNRLNLSNAVRNGYVRYFNSRLQAQQSERVGSLPYATRATGTANGDRGLSIDDETSTILTTVLRHPDNFLSRCRVVIIF